MGDQWEAVPSLIFKKKGAATMKKFVPFLLVVLLMLSISPNAFADNHIQVKHSIIESNTDTKSINVVIPIFNGFTGADRLNEKVLNLALDVIGETNAMDQLMEELREEMKKSGDPGISAVATLDMDYDYVKEGDLLSVRFIQYVYYGGAHGLEQFITFTSNTSTGEMYEFKDLFKNDVNYNSVVKELILKELEKNAEIYFSDYKETIANKNGDYKFYIDGDKIVVYFDLYEIAPYAAGIIQIAIDSEDVKHILKEEVYQSMKNGKERSNIIINGKSINTDKKIINQDDKTLIPLRVVAESLGYEVNWNPNGNAIVNEKVVKSSDVQSVVIDGTTYVSRSYFTDVLGAYVSFGFDKSNEIIVKVFSKEDEFIAKHPYDKLVEFQKPMNKDEAVTMYAEAVKNRHGIIQYGIMDDSVKNEKYEELKDMSFVTGVSSPWVDRYEINQIDENHYKIDFILKTSVPSEEFLSTVIVELAEDGEFINISKIEE